MLSVVLTSYNYARFLPAALEALAAQTRALDELIVIDDKSTDNSVAALLRSGKNVVSFKHAYAPTPMKPPVPSDNSPV